MSELEDLLVVYGAIDRAVVGNQGLAAEVSLVLDIYEPDVEGTTAAGWFEDYLRWTTELFGEEASGAARTLDDALASLSRTPPVGIMRTRRLIAIAALLRVAEVLDPPPDDDLLAAALGVDDGAAADLLGLLKPDQLRSTLAEDWAPFLEKIVAAGLTSDVLLLQAGIDQRCHCTLVRDKSGREAVHIEAQSTIDASRLSFKAATGFLDPWRWPGCHKLWCEMSPAGSSKSGNPIYHEVISLDCDGGSTPGKHAWRAETNLVFEKTVHPGMASVSYSFADGYPKANDVIVVDEGTLMVREIVTSQGTEISIATTKTVGFAGTISGRAACAFICVIGYDKLVEQFVLGCALKDPNMPRKPKTPLGGGQPPVRKTSSSRAIATAGAPARREAPVGSPTGGSAPVPVADPGAPAPSPGSESQGEPAPPQNAPDPTQQVVDTLKKCIDHWAAAYTTSYQKAVEGTYKADDLVGDVAQLWTRAMTDGLGALAAGYAAARSLVVDSAPAPDRPPTSES